MPLYTHNGSMITGDDVIAALRTVGVHEGDTIFVHSDISVFGKPELSGFVAFLREWVRICTAAAGPTGTVIMPTFTYSFGKGLPFDRQKSKSAVGSLTEFFRTEPGVVRTVHPMHSVAVWGTHASEILDINQDTFGLGTVFEKLRLLDASILLIGVSMDSCTFLHHVEQMHNVPYRFLKTFTGTLIDGGRASENSCTYFARKLDDAIDNDMTNIEPLLRAKGLLREVRVGNGTIGLIKARALFEEGMRFLDADSYGLTKSSS